ncbi:MAG: hypothetical protein ACFFER_11055 [Candidatus Thorarchaeota archaeon]
MNEQTEKDRITGLLQGNTMKVYALLLTHESMRMRDVQRKLRFSSPSLAIHHLQKLIDADLVVKDSHGDYQVKRSIRVGSLTLFVQIGKHFLPHFVFQVVLLTSILIPYLFFFMSSPPEGKDFLFIFVVLVSILFLAHGTYKIWFLKPM